MSSDSRNLTETSYRNVGKSIETTDITYINRMASTDCILSVHYELRVGRSRQLTAPKYIPTSLQ